MLMMLAGIQGSGTGALLADAHDARRQAFGDLDRELC